MKAIDKAKELVDKYENISMMFDTRNMDFDDTKQCALIAVNEILDILDPQFDIRAYPYWVKVKEEINKL